MWWKIRNLLRGGVMAGRTPTHNLTLDFNESRPLTAGDLRSLVRSLNRMRAPDVALVRILVPEFVDDGEEMVYTLVAETRIDR